MYIWYEDQWKISQRCLSNEVLDSNIHEAYMGPTWGWQDPGEPDVGPMNLAIRDLLDKSLYLSEPFHYQCSGRIPH